jgi:hypothetical protein
MNVTSTPFADMSHPAIVVLQVRLSFFESPLIVIETKDYIRVVYTVSIGRLSSRLGPNVLMYACTCELVSGKEAAGLPPALSENVRVG